MNFLIRAWRGLFRPRAAEHKPDYLLMALIAGILLFGLIMLSSASSAYAYARFGDSYYFLKNQIASISIGLAAFLFFAKVDYHIWKRYAFWFLLGSIILLVLVFIPGLSDTYGKARRWINIFGYSLQPSELVKLSFLLYLAAWLERRGKSLKNVSEGIGPFVFVLGVIGLLMILQPDLGTMIIIGVTSLIVYFAGGGPARHILVILVIGLIGVAALTQIKSYQMERVRCMLDPQYSAQDACYQINQSLIAVGSGGWWGRGFGASRQKHMYLPEVSSDSIFAVISEESGFFVSTALIFAYFLLFYRGALAAKRAPDAFGSILAIGIVSWITIQAIVNIGGMINLMPMTGLPLPFISSGGTAILAAMSGAGILVNISKQTRVH